MGKWGSWYSLGAVIEIPFDDTVFQQVVTSREFLSSTVNQFDKQSLFSVLRSPSSNHTGWLGVKHRLLTQYRGKCFGELWELAKGVNPSSHKTEKIERRNSLGAPGNTSKPFQGLSSLMVLLQSCHFAMSLREVVEAAWSHVTSDWLVSLCCQRVVGHCFRRDLA